MNKLIDKLREAIFQPSAEIRQKQAELGYPRHFLWKAAPVVGQDGKTYYVIGMRWSGRSGPFTIYYAADPSFSIPVSFHMPEHLKRCIAYIDLPQEDLKKIRIQRFKMRPYVSKKTGKFTVVDGRFFPITDCLIENFKVWIKPITLRKSLVAIK